MAEIDENFICGRCQGVIVPIGEEDGQIVFHCSRCGSGRQYECRLCHNPRTIWSEEKESAPCAGARYLANLGKSWSNYVPVKPKKTRLKTSFFL
jgi:hypothetical protein